MLKDNIKSTELKRYIALKANKLDYKDVTDEDFFLMEEIVFQGRLFNGAFSDADLEELRYFPNLKKVRITNFNITQDIVNLLLKLQHLKVLEFAQCEIDRVNFGDFSGVLQRISFSACGKLDFRYPRANAVDVMQSEMKLTDVDMRCVQTLDVIESVMREAHDLTAYEDIIRVRLDGTKLYAVNGTLLQDIRVANGTDYSHKEQFARLN